MSEKRVREAFQSEPTRAEREAEERAWPIVHSAYERRTSASPTHKRRNLILSVLGAGALVGFVLSPAGAAVRDAIKDAVEPGVRGADPSLTELPADGRLLATSQAGAWTVNEDGSKRLLPKYREATWSPAGAFVAATAGRQLVAFVADPEHDLADGQEPGTVRWTVSGDAPIATPDWSPSGFRVAYRERDSLHVVGGDGLGDGVLDGDISPVAPVWKPLSRELPLGASGTRTHVLAYVGQGDAVVVRHADSGRVLKEAGVIPNPRQLAWTADGNEVLALGAGGIGALSVTGSGDPSSVIDLPDQPREIATLPSDDRFAVLTTVRGENGVVRSVVDIRALGSDARRRVFDVEGRVTNLIASPDGEWLLLSWPDADQWLFVPVRGGDPKAVSNISSQFEPGQPDAQFPRVSGWCCG